MERQFQIINTNSGKTVLRAKHQFVCIEISTGKPRRPPQEFVDRYGPVVLNL
jgi:acyl-CoA thioester hydrolase